jgi:hypothetical protein
MVCLSAKPKGVAELYGSFQPEALKNSMVASFIAKAVFK